MSLVTIGWAGLIGGAGALGALARYLIGRIVVERTRSIFPWATLLINITGAFLIGLIAGLTTTHVLNSLVQTVLATGFLGGYTTFSTMSWEAMQLLREGSRRRGVLYLSGTVVPGLLAAALGLLLGGGF